jgi:exonuclease SbcD
LNPDAWTYCALGHYHIFEQLAPNMAYSGAPEFTSSNPWQEIESPKGFVLFDSETRDLSFIEVTPPRRFVDLAPIDATGLGVADLNAAIADRVASVEHERSVVRLVVANGDRDGERALAPSAQRAYKARAVAWKLDCRRADPMPRFREVTTERKKQLNSATGLRDLLAAKLSARELPSDVDRGEFVDLGLSYFDKASEAHGNTIVAEDAALTRQLEATIEHNLLQRTA